MSKTLKWILISISALIILLVILSKAGAFGKVEGTKVTAEKVKRTTIIEVVNASGKIYPEVEVKISPDISGEITELNVAEGDSVKKGQILARIYADVYNIQRNQAASGVAQSQAQVGTAQAQVNNTKAQVGNSQAAIEALKAQQDQAQRTYDMQKQLYDEKVISKNEFNIAESNLRSAKANFNAASQGIKGSEATVQSAKANVQSAIASKQSAIANLSKANKDLGRTVIVAPQAGVISLMNVKKGERVSGNSFTVGTEMMRIADMDKIEVRVDVGENDIPKVKLGDSAIVVVDAYNDKKFKGIVTQIASSNNGASNAISTTTDVTQYKVYIRILPESYMDLIGKGSFPFRPGMSASADIQTKTHTNVLCVPINAVTTRDKNDTINNTSKKVDDNSIKPKSSNDDDMEIVVFIIDKDNKAKKVKVKTDIQDINNIEIVEGLTEDEKVISGPYEAVSKSIKTGQLVKIVDKKDVFNEK